MSNTGINRMLNSAYWQNTVFPKFKQQYPIDAGKIEKEQAGNQRPLPTSDFARGIVEEIRLHPLVSNPITDFGVWEKPTVFLHAARGGVEYQEEQVKYFGTSAYDLNSVDPNDPLSSWDSYIARANTVGLKTVPWRHCHTYTEVQNFLNVVKAHPLKTGGLNLESIYSEGLLPSTIASMIDNTLGTSSILGIPTLGWMDGLDWSPLSRHVFQLEFFLNDPPPNGEWSGIPYIELAKQLAYHARVQCGVKKLTFVCGIYPTPSGNPYGEMLTAAQYKNIIASAGERFGGIYLGDNNGPNYAQWG